MTKNKKIILEYINNLIKEDVNDYISLSILHEDDFWSDDKWMSHHDRHVVYNEVKFNPEFSYFKKEVRFPSFADKNKVMKLKYNYSDELDDEVYYESLDNYLKEANEFMNDTTITDGYMTKNFSGRYTDYVLIKFRKSKNPQIFGSKYCEYVMYEPVYSQENKLIRRKIISYGLTFRDVVYSRDGELSDYDPEIKVKNTFKTKHEDIQYFRIPKTYLTEANRQQLLNKSKLGRSYKNTSKGRNRFERRTKSKISATVRDYNNIQMDQFFKRDILEIKLPVIGETDVYEVDIRVDNLLAEVQKQVLANKGVLEFKVILQSLLKCLNLGNVYIGCSCPDGKYRMAYNQTKNGYKAGYKETRPSKITNPNDDLGAGCKHVLLILANLDWTVKVASVINNYIKYMQEHYQQAYADYMFPKIYGTPYKKAVQMNLFYNGMLPDDKKTMDEITANSLKGRDKQGKFISDNPYVFNKKDMETIPENPNQLKLDLEEPKEKELKID